VEKGQSVGTKLQLAERSSSVLLYFKMTIDNN
jgi:hypothetical protein